VKLIKTLISFVCLFALLGMPLPTKACDLDSLARSFWQAYANVNYGAGVVNCTAKMCGGADRWWCRTNSNPWFWDIKGTQSCGYGGSSENYQVWHDLGGGWTYAGSNFTCFCQGSNGYCQWN
jgi:hypothetical protein